MDENTRSEASRKGWATRKANPYYYSDEAKQKRSESAKKAADTRRFKKGMKHYADVAKQKRRDSAKKATETDEPIDQTDVVMETLNEIQDTLDGYEPPTNISGSLQDIKRNDATTLKNIVDGAISRDGREEVARRCEANATALLDLVNDILYASGKKSNDLGREGFQRKVNEFARIVNGMALTIDESADLTERSEEAEEPEDDE